MNCTSSIQHNSCALMENQIVNSLWSKFIQCSPFSPLDFPLSRQLFIACLLALILWLDRIARNCKRQCRCKWTLLSQYFVLLTPLMLFLCYDLKRLSFFPAIRSSPRNAQTRRKRKRQRRENYSFGSLLTRWNRAQNDIKAHCNGDGVWNVGLSCFNARYFQ